MADQIDALQRLKVPATIISSDLIPDENEGRLQLMEQRALKFVYLTPERFDPARIRNRAEIERLTRHRPAYLVIDEAHCVDRWGSDFRPSYGRLSEVRKTLGNPPVLAFTATAGKKAQQRIISALGTPDSSVSVSGVDRPNITQFAMNLVQEQTACAEGNRCSD